MILFLDFFGVTVQVQESTEKCELSPS